MTPRDVLELGVLDSTGDVELAAQAGRLAALTVEVHAELLAHLTCMPAGFHESQLWAVLA